MKTPLQGKRKSKTNNQPISSVEKIEIDPEQLNHPIVTTLQLFLFAPVLLFLSFLIHRSVLRIRIKARFLNKFHELCGFLHGFILIQQIEKKIRKKITLQIISNGCYCLNMNMPDTTYLLLLHFRIVLLKCRTNGKQTENRNRSA